jgi:polyhydroxyalkanoate synthase
LRAPGAAPGAEFTELTLRISETLTRLRAAAHVEYGGSLKQAVWSCGKTTLFRYAPLTATTRPRPVLICFALVNRPYVLDLQPDRSLVRRLLEAGLEVYLIDWGDPGDAERHVDLEAYIEQHLGGSVRHIRSRHEGEPLELLGVCQGGVLSLCYAALHREDVAHLITVTTPVDFHTPDNLLSKWVRDIDTELLERCGNVPGELLNGLFLALMPLRLMQQKYVRLLTSEPDQRAVEDFVRMEKWIFDSPPQAASALAQFVRWFYQENRLVHDTLSIGGRRVRLADIRQPLLNLYALEDHIVPASASMVLGQYVGSRDYSACAIPTGHIGMYVSRAGGAQVPDRIISWLTERN